MGCSMSRLVLTVLNWFINIRNSVNVCQGDNEFSSHSHSLVKKQSTFLECSLKQVCDSKNK